MSDGMSDARDYGPSLSKHGSPLVSKEGKPFEQDVHRGIKCDFCGLFEGHSNACIDVRVRVERNQWKERAEKAEQERDEAWEACARIAESWEPPMPPSFNSLALQSEAEQLDAKLRPIQIQVAKNIAGAIRDRSRKPEEKPGDDDSGFPTAQDLKIYNAVREFYGGCKRHGIEDCRTCKEG